MTDLNKDFREFIESLNKNGVEYLIVGGYAVGFHGFPRFTQDLDIWVRPTVENAERALKALKSFGFPTDKLSIEVFSEPDSVLQIGRPPNRIDILTSLDGVTFESCYKRRAQGIVDGIRTKFIGKADLKKNKKASGRKRDLGDLEELG
jgi:hypothetical protein